MARTVAIGKQDFEKIRQGNIACSFSFFCECKRV